MNQRASSWPKSRRKRKVVQGISLFIHGVYRIFGPFHTRTADLNKAFTRLDFLKYLPPKEPPEAKVAESEDTEDKIPLESLSEKEVVETMNVYIKKRISSHCVPVYPRLRYRFFLLKHCKALVLSVT